MAAFDVRFHPLRRTGGAGILVARISDDSGPKRIEPLVDPETVAPEHSAALLAKLAYIVQSYGAASLSDLQDLRSDFWSFEEVRGRSLTEEGAPS